MNQTTSTDTHPVDLEALRLQLEGDGKAYDENQNTKGRERLLHTLQTNDCREIITAVADGDDLANAFVVATCKGHNNILEAYLNHGMNIDIKDRYGTTALTSASYYKHEQCVRLLLNHNANVNVQNIYGFTALMRASQRGHAKIVKMLLEENANLDLQDKNGWTALMDASACDKKDVVQLLLNHGADIELKNNDGKTALDLARNNVKEMIRNHVPITGHVLK